MRLALAALAFLASGVPVRASIVDVSFIGTQSGGAADVPGLFGQPNTNLTPSAFTLTFRFDLSKGTTYPAPGGGTDIIGGTGFSPPTSTISPSLGWSVTVDGVTVQVPDGSTGAQLQVIPGTPSTLDVAAIGPSATPGQNNVAVFDFSSADGSLPSTLNANYNYLVKPGDGFTPGGPFFVIWAANGSGVGLNSGQLSITEITFSVEAPAARPGAGLFGLAGLAALGLAMRARRRDAA
jgi:hypothetical protein